MDKRLTQASGPDEKLWYAFRNDTDYAELVAPEYLGTAGWHAETETGRAAALTRAYLRYFWVPQDALSVSRERPDCLPDEDPAHTLDGWVNPLGVSPGLRQEVSENNFRIAQEYRAQRNSKKNRKNDNKEI